MNYILLVEHQASLVVQMVNNLPAILETWVWCLYWEDTLQEGMAIHSSILAWRIPQTEEHPRLQSTGSQRDGLDWATFTHSLITGLPWWLSGIDSGCNVGDSGDVGSIPGSGRSPGGGHGSPLQYSCLENPVERWAWQAMVHGVTKSQTWLEWLNTSTAQWYY